MNISQRIEERHKWSEKKHHTRRNNDRKYIHATKDQYAEALKGYRNSLNETESPEREMAKAKLRPLPADQR